MKKLLLMIVALSFIAAIPKVASAFTVYELVDVDVLNVAWSQGTTMVDIQQGKGASAVKIEGIEASSEAVNSLAAGLSLKSKKFIHANTNDTDGDGVLELTGFMVGETDIPAYM